jgi:hypothetical protein
MLGVFVLFQSVIKVVIKVALKWFYFSTTGKNGQHRIDCVGHLPVNFRVNDLKVKSAAHLFFWWLVYL